MWERRVRRAIWCAVLLLALVEAWRGRWWIHPDAVSYLDLSDTFSQRDWHTLLSSVWSPLYPFLLGLSTFLIRPSAYWEIPVAHLVNFGIFCGALWSFEFLLTSVIDHSKPSDLAERPCEHAGLPRWSWRVLGYSLFAWSTLVAVDLRVISPDLCVLVCVFLSAALVTRMRAGNAQWPSFVLLGVVLGAGYFAKAVMFPLAFVFLLVAFLATRMARKSFGLPLLSAVTFAVLAAPVVGVESSANGHLTPSESGRLNYLFFVDGVPMLPLTRQPDPRLLNPVPRLYDEPEVFGFGQPERGTYPLWDDDVHWNAGLSPSFHVGRQLVALAKAVRDLYSSCLLPLWGLVVGGLALLLMSCEGWTCFRRIIQGWPLLIPAFAAVCLYLPVHVEARYLGPFIVLAALGILSGIRVSPTRESRKLAAVVSVLVAVSISLSVVSEALYRPDTPDGLVTGRGGVYREVAIALNKSGVQPGDRVAVMGNGWIASFWARMARVRIAAQVAPDEPGDFWAAGPAVKAQVMKALAKTGVRAAVSGQAPPPAQEGWTRLGNTGYFAYLFSKSGP